MVNYYGDFAEDDTVLIPFNTFSSDDPAASVTITNLADADLKVHKDGGTTQIVTDGATIAIDFDGITGNHLATIDTSAHADYATGSEYAVRMEGTTIDGATVNAWIGAFSIERAGGALALLKGTNSLANIEDKIDIIDTNVDDVEADLANGTDGLGALKTLIDTVNTDLANGTDGLGALKTLIDTVNTDLANGTDGLGALKTLIDTVNTDLSNGTDGLGALKTLIDALNDITAASVWAVDATGQQTAGTFGEALGDPAATGESIRQLVGEFNAAAAAGDPSTTESVMQYVKQIVNVLVGSTGVTTFPAAADPANGVSIAEVLRRIFDDTDPMTYTKANELDVNTQSINGAAIVGDGNATPFDGA